jgi:ATP-dependent Clp endopeptidase proteolytic subunit ClpP
MSAMRKLLLMPHNRQGSLPEPSDRPWYKIVNKKKDDITKVYLYDAIGGWFGVDVNEFIKDLNDIDTSELHLHINSPGGSVYDGIAIYNTLRQHDSKVTVYVDALAASAASFIALAGEKLIVARNSTVMIHDAIGACMGNMQDMLDTADLLDDVSENIADIYAYNAGGDKAEWRGLMKAETWYTAAEAVEAGLADEMLDADPEEEDEDADTENKWDLSKIFNYAGRDKAPSPKQIREQVRNQLKEASMGKTAPKATTEGTQPSEPSTQNPPEPGGQPTPAPATPPEDEPAVEEEPPAQPEPAGTEPPPTNRALVSHVVNGVSYRMPQAVHAHLSNLETFRQETIEGNRVEFVENLARQNKIAATQIGNRADGNTPATGLIAFALGLSDEQFSSWKASFDSAPEQSLFAQHGIEPGDTNAPTRTGAENVQGEIENLEQIIADHRRAGLSQEKIESKASWKRLQDLKSQQTNA